MGSKILEGSSLVHCQCFETPDWLIFVTPRPLHLNSKWPDFNLYLTLKVSLGYNFKPKLIKGTCPH